MVKHKRLSREEIQTKIFLRLSEYLYDDFFPEITGHKPQSKYGEIRNLLSNDPKSRILTLDKTFSNGWLFLDLIEQEPCPYGSPEAHRHLYLNHDFIEKGTFIYYVKKQGDKNRRQYREPVYRLNPNKRNSLNEWFRKKSKYMDYMLFKSSAFNTSVLSNIYSDQSFGKGALIYHYLSFIERMFEYKEKKGLFLKDKDMFEAYKIVIDFLNKMLYESKEYIETKNNIDAISLNNMPDIDALRLHNFAKIIKFERKIDIKKIIKMEGKNKLKPLSKKG